MKKPANKAHAIHRCYMHEVLTIATERLGKGDDGRYYCRYLKKPKENLTDPDVKWTSPLVSEECNRRMRERGDFDPEHPVTEAMVNEYRSKGFFGLIENSPSVVTKRYQAELEAKYQARMEEQKKHEELKDADGPTTTFTEAFSPMRALHNAYRETAEELEEVNLRPPGLRDRRKGRKDRGARPSNPQ